MLVLERSKRVERLFADHDELALEGILVGAIGSARDHALADDGHRIDDCLAEAIERGRDIAPADETLAFLFDEPFELALDEFARFGWLREEAHGDGIVALLRQVVAVIGGPFAQQRVGYLQQDPRTVAHQRIGTDRTAVVEIGKNLERLRDDGMALRALDMRDHADAAGVVFVTRIVETRYGLGRRASHQRCVLLRAHPPASHGVRGSREHGRAVPITAPAKLREGS